MRAALEGHTLPADAQQLIGNAEEIFGLSIFSLWEAAKKHEKGKLPLPMDISAWLKAAVPQNVQVLPLTPDIIVESTRLPEFPINDPGDQLIVATARIHKLTLLTTDTKLRAYRHTHVRYFTPILEKN
jgi:PIN domain nuclease of toxin-antitoxin system